jgi:hypothetical protein
MAKPSGFSSGFGPGFGVGRYHYGFAQYEWDAAGFWQLPPSVVGAVDLRPLSAQGTPVIPSGFAFVASLQPVDVLISRSLHFSTEDATTGMRDAWESELGYRPQGAKLVDLLWDYLTNGSDPEGESGPKPLMAGVDNTLKLFVGGHSLVKSQRFNLLESTPYSDRVRTLLQHDYEQHHSGNPDHARKVLDFWCDKYRLEKRDNSQWQRLIPQRLRVGHRGPLKHETTITDNFNRADANPVGSPWNAVVGNHRILSNELRGNTGGPSHTSNHTTALSSEDHYSQVAVGTQGAGTSQLVSVRQSNSALTCYAYMPHSGVLRKYVASTPTNLASGSAQTSSAGNVLYLEANGSSLQSKYNGGNDLSVTDTAITGVLFVGLINVSNASYSDNFEGGDLSAASSVSVPIAMRHYLRMMGAG